MSDLVVIAFPMVAGQAHFSLVREAPRYFGRRKSPAETRRLLLGLVGTGVRAANQAASVVRGAAVTAVPNVVHRTPMHPGGTHADRTVVGPSA